MVEDLPILDRRIEAQIQPVRAGWEARYYWHGLSMINDLDGRSMICDNYAKTLEWILRYYYGEAIDRGHHYKYPLPPLWTDLSPHLLGYSSTPQVSKEGRCCTPKELLDFVLSNAQKRDYLTPTEIKIDNSKKHVHWAYARYLWEARVM